jgi:hypothetical protein
MKVRLETVIKDPRTARALKLKKPYGRFEPAGDEVFLDGPVSRRVAVVDFEPGTGELSPPVRFQPPTNRRKIGRYAVADPDNVHALDMLKVSVFGTVLKTMAMFEEPDNLGRKLTWAFDAPQLLVVPRAGRWPNAYYERDSHSLQFFYFPSAHDPKVTIYTALSHDIVAHETGHAILDGIAPDLFNAISPQALAMHEAIADITALLMAFRLKDLREAVLEETGGSIAKSSAFSGIAAEFAAESDPAGRRLFLRDLDNARSLRPEAGVDHVAGVEPHALSEVLGGALYAVLRKIYDAVWTSRQRQNPDKTALELAGEALFAASERFKRMVLRALDYLPPGEASFADLGRAILASDLASYPDQRDAQQRDWFRAEFLARGFVDSDAALDVALPESERNALEAALAKIDLDTLVSSDWAAYAFVNANRKLLHVPPRLSFHIRPRLDVTKRYYVRAEAAAKDGADRTYTRVDVRECILKVKWDHQEPSGLGSGYPGKRRITLGTTLAIDWKTKKVRARLTSDPSAGQCWDRDRLLRRLVADGVLKFDGAALGPDGHLLPSVICAEAQTGVMAVRGTARLMHVACCPLTEEGTR